MPGVVYLHGFASGPGSTKGTYFRRRFAQLGVDFQQPDLNEADFHGLTLTRQLKLVDRVVRQERPELLMGSSLGGYLAALYASQRPELVGSLVLLAPAFSFAERFANRLGEKAMLEWERTGEIEVFHYGDDAHRTLGFQLYRDGIWHDPFPDVEASTLVLHGRNDRDVDPELSLQFARGRDNVAVELLNSDHGLTDVLDTMWERVSEFYQTNRLLAAAD